MPKNCYDVLTVRIIMKYFWLIVAILLSPCAIAQVSSGTAFAVAPGLLVTNHHVVNGCASVEIITGEGRRAGTIVNSEELIDLALIRVTGLKGGTARLRTPRNVRLGESVMVFGFPLAGTLTSGGNFTAGLVSGLRGFRDAMGEIQITAPVQPGNSGGPVMDATALVIGVVQAKLITTGDIPQNVNFAISLETLSDFLARNRVQSRESAPNKPLDTAAVAELAKSFTYPIECRGKTQKAASLPPSPPPHQVPAPQPAACIGPHQATTWTNCIGTLSRADRSVYVGAFIAGAFEGPGTLTLPNGSSYTGTFAKGKYEGQGTYTFPSGTKYVGSFKNGYYNGKGIYSIANGETYEGDFVNGKYDGTGTQVFPDRKKYVGSFKDDKWVGSGTLTLPNGDSYVGAFNNSKFNGNGTYTAASGRRLVGEFKDDLPDGPGIISWPNGVSYEGVFKSNRFFGQGTVTWPDTGLAINDIGLLPDQSSKIQPPENKQASTRITNRPPRSNGDIRARDWSEKSLESAKLGDWIEAIRFASAAIAADPGYAPAYVNRCWAYIAKGYLDEAIGDCNLAIAIDPNNAAAMNNRGLIRQAQGDIKSALVDFEYACKSSISIACGNFQKIEGYSPTDIPSFIKKQLAESLIKYEEKDWDSVIKIATRVLDVAPTTTEAWVSRSGALANKGLLAEALSDAEAAIRLNPDFAMSYNNRGYVYQLMGRLRQAALDYEISCSLKLELACANLRNIQRPN